MTTEFIANIAFDNGYWPNQGLIGGERVPNSMIEGSKNVWIEGPNRIRSWNGTTSAGSYGNLIMGLLGSNTYTMTAGSATLYKNGATFFIGSGSVVVNGTFYGVATSALAIVITPGTVISTTTLQIGLADVPVASAATTTAARILPGTYSFKYTYERTTTGSESSASVSSNVITLDGTKKAKIDFPFANINVRNVYASKRGFPEGPWFKIPDGSQYSNVALPVAGATLSVELDFRDADLLEIFAPLDNDQPPAGTHCFALGDVMVVAGCFGGGGIAFSKPGKPEAFSPEALTFLTPNEPIIGIRGRPADGWQYVFCRNSLHSCYLTGDDLVPVQTRAIWSETGIANANAATFVGGEFYGYSGKRGALRTTAGNQSAEPDVSFAIPIESDMESWNPDNVVVGYSLDDDCVVYFHGNQAWPYKRKIQKWSAPFTLADGGASGNVTSCVTHQGRLIFAIGSAMYSFSGGTSNTPAVIMPVWQDPAFGYYKTITGYRTAFDTGTTNLTTELLTNFVTSTVKDTQTSTGANANYGTWRKINVKKVKSFTLRYSFTGANKYVYGSTVVGGTTKMRTP